MSSQGCGPLEHWTVRTALPLLAQAGTSVPGQRPGARFANALFASHPNIPQARRYRDSVRAQAAAFGRNPDEPYVYQAISPVVADSREDALERIRELDDLITDQQVLDFLQDYFTGQIDFTGRGADATVAQSGIPTIASPEHVADSLTAVDHRQRE